MTGGNATAGATVLVVDDEPAILRALRAGLEARGFRVRTASDGQGAIDIVALEAPDVVVLDLGLPDLDGVDVCRRIRGWSDVPIVVLSADGSDQRKVVALDEGADDYVTKPFSMAELLARVRVALRHRPAARAGTVPIDDAILDVGDLRVDLARRHVSVGARRIDLTPKEFAFLVLLARWPGRVLTHGAILAEVWGPGYESESQYLRVYASQLRKKLDDDPSRPRLITEPGVGYRLVDPSESGGEPGSEPSPGGDAGPERPERSSARSSEPSSARDFERDLERDSERDGGTPG